MRSWPFRVALATVLVGAVWGTALFLHRRDVTVHVAAVGHPKPYCAGSCYEDGAIVLGYSGGTPAHSYSKHPGWEDPVALGLTVAVVGIGAGLAMPRLRRGP